MICQEGAPGPLAASNVQPAGPFSKLSAELGGSVLMSIWSTPTPRKPWIGLVVRREADADLDPGGVLDRKGEGVRLVGRCCAGALVGVRRLRGAPCITRQVGELRDRQPVPRHARGRNAVLDVDRVEAPGRDALHLEPTLKRDHGAADTSRESRRRQRSLVGHGGRAAVLRGLINSLRECGSRQNRRQARQRAEQGLCSESHALAPLCTRMGCLSTAWDQRHLGST